MKHSGIIVLLAAAALLAGCAKDNGLKETRKGEPVIFTATIEQTKTALTIEEKVGKLVWEEGDEITINGVAYVATPDTENPAKATFAPKGTDEAEAVDGMYYAVYGCEFDVATQKGVLPSVQTYNANSLAGVAPMYAESEDTELSFVNSCSLLEITLKGDASVASIAVSSNNIPMCGEFSVGDGYALVHGEGCVPVTLECGGAKLSSDGVKFYVAVPCGIFLGLKIKVTATDGKVWSIVSSKYANIDIHRIYPLTFTPVFEDVILLSSVFDVNAEGGKVQFVKANLIYSDGEYSFANYQTNAGTLFSASEVEAIDPATITSQPIRLLSSAEWSYLLGHTNKVKLYKAGAYNGVILIPNDLDMTTETNWRELEASGAVFITAAGYAYGSSAVCGSNEGGSYWTSDYKCFDFDACELYVGNDAPATIKQAVRYVVDVK